ncbi:Neutral trehalase [Fusarium oxysporum f. sp. cubense]|uniref:Cytosolic neutral trehalase n=1 Tax=Fusarium oxysporum f. sp. cubense TaxID=61366 RepID=A0A559LY06_FUSOC|nr:Neutral trehalase [Fusarium oxysporum f. sp. cubense]
MPEQLLQHKTEHPEGRSTTVGRPCVGLPFWLAPSSSPDVGRLLRYGFTEEAERLAYKWIYTILKAFVDFNGVVVESYGPTESVDPQRCSYQKNSDDPLPYFKAINTTGCAASNGSVIYGLQILNAHSEPLC